MIHPFDREETLSFRTGRKSFAKNYRYRLNLLDYY